jgi:4-amino-4-deoxy-L-arabinose transferase-like glycosyltransferase
MDDVDSVQAMIGRNMVTSGDWVTAHLDGVPFLEKAPLIYWMVGVSYKIFGAHDWAARIPVALSAISLCWVTAAFGTWAFGKREGFYAGLTMATCVGLWLFTRILLPDATLTLVIALAMWALLRVLDDEEPHPRAWAAVFAASLGTGLLLKSLIGVLFPVGAGALYLLVTRQFFSRRTWVRLRPWMGIAIVLLVAAPWHVLATLRNPPYFSFSMRSVPGEYHGFLWFFFINEQLLRFLNLRYPRDYDTVPRLWFWLFSFIWLFPWSVYLPGALKLSYKPTTRAGQTRLLALCWIAFVMVFFTFSTTQEYYSMPCYPALALLIGSSMALEGRTTRWGTRVLTLICAVAAASCIGMLLAVRHLPTPGDISQALSTHPGAYKLSLGHMEDLTVNSFAYLRLPLALAAIAFTVGVAGGIAGSFRRQAQGVYLAIALMMVLFFHAARVAMIRFDPFLSSRPLVSTLDHSPPGKLIIDHHYFWFSSVFFYTNRTALLLDGRYFGMVYGSYAPGAPDVFLNDDQFRHLWQTPDRYYIFCRNSAAVDHLHQTLGTQELDAVAVSGGKYLLTNHPIPKA